MVNKKVYNNPEITVAVVENTDAIMISNNPSVGDVSWNSSLLGGGDNESL